MKELLTFLIVIVIHESGHIITALLCGAGIRRIRPVFFGLRIELTGIAEISYFRELMIVSGGVIFNIISLFLPIRAPLFHAYSLGAAIYNLIPLTGSDGGGIIYIITLYLSGDTGFSSAVRHRAESLGVLLLWVFAVYLNLVGRGMLPLLLASVILIIMQISSEKRG